MSQPSGREINVETDPVNAAPSPAIWPSGSIARALKLPNNILIQKNVPSSHAMKNHNGGTPLFIILGIKKMP